MRPKISVIGAGMVGGQAAYTMALRELGNIVLLDLNGDMAKGKALDMAQSLSVNNTSISIVGGSNYKLTQNSDVVVIVAGMARKPGMTREELLGINAKIVADVSKKAAKYSKKAIFVVVTNPLDVMTYVAKRASKFPKNRVLGMAGVLDSSRFKLFLARAAKVSVESVQVLVMGTHGETMVPMQRYALINGIPATEVLGKKKVEDIVKQVKGAGAEIVKLLKKGSAYFAPGASVAEVVESIVKDQKKVLPCSVYLNGEYGVKNCCIGVPAVLGKNGVEGVIKVKFNASEKTKFAKAVKSIKSMIKQI